MEIQLDTTRAEQWVQLQGMVDAFAQEMKARLYQKLQQGYDGWDDPKQTYGIAQHAVKDGNAIMLLESKRLTKWRKPEDTPEEVRTCVDAANRLAMVWHVRSKEA